MLIKTYSKTSSEKKETKNETCTVSTDGYYLKFVHFIFAVNIISAVFFSLRFFSFWSVCISIILLVLAASSLDLKPQKSTKTDNTGKETPFKQFVSKQLWAKWNIHKRLPQWSTPFLGYGFLLFFPVHWYSSELLLLFPFLQGGVFFLLSRLFASEIHQ